MTTNQADAIAFETTVAGSGGKTGIVIPDDVIHRLGAGHRPPVHVEVNGHAYRSTVAVMGGQHLVGVNAAVRAATGLEAGHPVSVALAVATTPRAVEVPPDLAEALAGDDQARAFFDGLSYSQQRWFVSGIESAKKAETRQRRISAAVERLHEGRGQR